ncbi:MAG TPA: type II secretion system protein GspN [Thermodesulfovibrionales bacterium]|nr:type II secretion system protein GspN [Thermodesulfovibrionales bacterium]
MKKAATICVVLVLVIFGLWFVALPESLIISLIDGSLGKENLDFQTEGFGKGLFYNFNAEKIVLREKGVKGDSYVPLLVFRNVHGWLDFMSLFRIHPELDFEGEMNGGEVAGKVGLTGKENLAIRGNTIRIKGIPFLDFLGIQGDGLLSGDFHMSNDTGEVKFSVADASLKSTSWGGGVVPLEVFHEIKGAATIKNETVEVRSLALSGKGVYGRVRGSIKGMDADMSFELMTDSSFTLGSLTHAVLGQYKVSPGYYVVPLKGKMVKVVEDHK